MVTAIGHFLHKYQLAEGTHSLTATATDAAGNTGPASAAVDVVVDTTAPGAPVITSPVAGSQKTPISQISGNAEADSTVEVFNGQTSLGTATTISDPDGDWWSVSTQLGEGTYSFTAKATDKAGNTGDASAAVNVVVDTIAPDTKIESATDGDNIDVISVGSSNSLFITFSFVGSPDSDTDHYVCNIIGDTYIDPYPCVSHNQLTIPSAKLDPDGYYHYTFTVAAVDAVGNKDQTPAEFEWLYSVPVL